VTFRDYMYRDVFEFKGRQPCADQSAAGQSQCLAQVKSDSEAHQTQFVQNIMMFFSISLYIPPSFTYRTPR